MTDVCSSHLFKSGIFVVLTAALVSAGTDIQHHEVRDGKSTYTFVNGTQRNCLPILAPEYCPEGHEIKPCFHDNQTDRCVPCSEGEEQLDKTYSDFASQCYIISCPEGTIAGKRNPSSGCSLPCRCENERMVMNEHCSCQQVEVQCGSNTYLKNGVCLPCPEGTHKPGNSIGPCVTTMSPEISRPLDPATAATPPALSTSETNTSGVHKNRTRNITVKYVTNGDIDTEEEPPNNSSENTQRMSTQAIAIVTLVVVLVVMGLSAAITCKLWKRKLPSHNSDHQNDSSESLMQPQVAEVRDDPSVSMSNNPPPYSCHDAQSPFCVNMEDDDRQGMAQPWTKDFGEQATGDSQADRVPLHHEGVTEVTVHEQDTDETGLKEYYESGQTPSEDQQDPNTGTLRKSNRYLDAGRASFPTLESTEQPSSVEPVTCKDADETSIKKQYKASISNENTDALGEIMETSLFCLRSAPPLNTDSFKSDNEK